MRSVARAVEEDILFAHGGFDELKVADIVDDHTDGTGRFVEVGRIAAALRHERIEDRHFGPKAETF